MSTTARTIGATAVDVLVLLAASTPMYLIAVWRYASAYLSTASSEELGWMVILFPLLALPPLLPWLVTALPAAVALAIRSVPMRCVLLVAAVVTLTLSEQRFFVIETTFGERVGSNVGDVSFGWFVAGIWILTGVMWLTTIRTGRKPIAD